MKEPVYKGPKKNHAAIFLRESKELDCCSIRTFHSKPIGRWESANGNRVYNYVSSIAEGDNEVYEACWDDDTYSDEKAVAHMKSHDAGCGHETIFLGYVKDTE